MHHLVVGAGPAGVIAAESLRKICPADTITIVSDEPHSPYSRMAIPYLLARDVGEDGTYLRHGKNHYEQLEIEIRNDAVTQIDPANSKVSLRQGGELAYDRLLIATGSRAIRPPISGMDSPRIHNCWTLADAQRLAKDVNAGDRVVLLGAGFIGCIVLQALVAMELQLTVVELEDRMLARMMDHAGGAMIKNWCETKGVRVRTATKAVAVNDTGSDLEIELGDGSAMQADHIVCAAGVRPNIEFLAGSGIDIDAGIVVDYALRTSIADIYAAGDVAQGPDRMTGSPQVHAIQPTASEHGRIAASQMAGADAAYGGSLSMNVLNTLGLITSSFGLWDGTDGGDRAIAEDRAHNRYLRLEFQEDVLVGALAIGLTDHVGVLRGLIQTKVRLGDWKKRLLDDPSQVMSAYLARVQGTRN